MLNRERNKNNIISCVNFYSIFIKNYVYYIIKKNYKNGIINNFETIIYNKILIKNFLTYTYNESFVPKKKL